MYNAADPKPDQHNFAESESGDPQQHPSGKYIRIRHITGNYLDFFLLYNHKIRLYRTNTRRQDQH